MKNILENSTLRRLKIGAFTIACPTTVTIHILGRFHEAINQACEKNYFGTCDYKHEIYKKCALVMHWGQVYRRFILLAKLMEGRWFNTKKNSGMMASITRKGSFNPTESMPVTQPSPWVIYLSNKRTKENTSGKIASNLILLADRFNFAFGYNCQGVCFWQWLFLLVVKGILFPSDMKRKASLPWGLSCH